MDGEPSQDIPRGARPQAPESLLGGLAVPAGDAGEAPRPPKLVHHVEGIVEPWSQRPDLDAIVPQDLAAPAPARAKEDTEFLLAATQELRQKAELGEMARAIVTEIRHPLAGIAATAEVFRDSFHPSDPRRGGLDALLAEVERLETLTRNLADYAQSHAPRLLESDVADDVGRVARAVADQARAAGVELVVEVPEVCTPVLIDSELIQHAFLHVARNAIEAMPHGGALFVRVLEPDVDSGFVCATFTDTGAGLLRSDLRRAFEPFFTTRPDGVGLGLAVARRLVECQGGHLTAESIPGSGACFAAYLPRADVARS